MMYTVTGTSDGWIVSDGVKHVLTWHVANAEGEYQVDGNSAIEACAKFQMYLLTQNTTWLLLPWEPRLVEYIEIFGNTQLPPIERVEALKMIRNMLMTEEGRVAMTKVLERRYQ